MPCCHRPSHVVSISRDQSGSRRKHARSYFAWDFLIQSKHGIPCEPFLDPQSSQQTGAKLSVLHLQRKGCLEWEHRVRLLGCAGSQLPLFGVPSRREHGPAPFITHLDFAAPELKLQSSIQGKSQSYSLTIALLTPLAYLTLTPRTDSTKAASG